MPTVFELIEQAGLSEPAGSDSAGSLFSLIEEYDVEDALRRERAAARESQQAARQETLQGRRDEEQRRWQAAEEAQVEGMAETLGFDNRVGRFLASGLLKAGTAIEGVVARAKEGDFPGIPNVAQAASYVIDPAGLAGADFQEQAARDGGSVADAVNRENLGITAGRQQADRDAGLSEREVWWMDQGEGVTSSLATMAAALPAGPYAPAVMAGTFGAQSANEALTRVRDDHPEWSDDQQELYAASIGTAEGFLTWAFGKADKGAREFAEQEPEAAEKIVENPSRKVVQEATGIDPKEMNKQERETLAEALKQTKAGRQPNESADSPKQEKQGKREAKPLTFDKINQQIDAIQSQLDQLSAGPEHEALLKTRMGLEQNYMDGLASRARGVVADLLKG